jgi:hypothetical protein
MRYPLVGYSRNPFVARCVDRASTLKSIRGNLSFFQNLPTKKIYTNALILLVKTKCVVIFVAKFWEKNQFPRMEVKPHLSEDARAPGTCRRDAPRFSLLTLASVLAPGIDF